VALPIIFTRDWTMKGRGSEDEERSQGTLIDSTFRTKKEDSNIRDMQKITVRPTHERQVPPKVLDI
jgi:hypothetical protein